MIIPSARRHFPVALAAAGATLGAIVALHYYRLGLTLSHYDARAHLVVARRIFDSLTPGWQQIGAVWLPLPHLLNAVPVQVDAWYRSGASAVAISVAAFAGAVGAIGWIILQATGSRAAAVGGVAAFALNPNVLYLQATPMTEPLSIAFTTLAVALLMRWCTIPSCPTCPSPPLIGAMWALACLTRYEAWPAAAMALAIATYVHWKRGALEAARKPLATIALFPALSIGAFMLFSRVVVGDWFVSGGFFVPENDAMNDPIESISQVGRGLYALSGFWLVAAGALGALMLVMRGLIDERRSHLLVPLSLIGAAALPWAAFMAGHPYRVRYMIPLLAVQSIGAGVAAGLWRRARPIALVLLVAAMGEELRPFDLGAPMILEAQWDGPNARLRQQVTRCLGTPGSSGKIMASMGSLGHYMQETSHAGFRLRDFLHEGNGDLWLSALSRGPRPFVEWVMIEEQAEGGDMLAARARRDAMFLDGYTRVCEGGGVALYRRAEGRGLSAEGQNLNPIVNR